jgi:sugar phosphate permease
MSRFRTIHYGWFVAVLAFVTLLVGAGIRSTPGVLMIPMEHDLNLTTAAISLAVAINIALFGLMGPFTAALMQTIGVRRTILLGLTICAIATAATSQIHTATQLTLTWGIGVGLGSGLIGMVVAATVATRWFTKRRGTVVGLLTAANATGQLVFLPVLARVAQHYGWRPLGLMLSGVAAIVFVLIALFMRDRPQDIGLQPYGQTGTEILAVPVSKNPITTAFSALARASKKRDFWLLSGSFFICGASTSGFIGTHFIPACGDHGIPVVGAAGYLALMGAFDLVGTTLSGWLSDRWSSRYLLFAFYALRGVSLLFVTQAFGIAGLFGLPLFAMFYGLDWIATLPPTVKLAVDAFGKEEAPIVFGWISASHQLGAAAIVGVAGFIRTTQGSYDRAFMLSALLCFIAALMVLGVGRGKRAAAVMTLSGAPG